MDLFPLWNSLRIASISIVIVFVLGIIIAYWVKKCPRIIKGILDVFFTLSLVLPPTVIGYLLLLIFGPNRPIGQFFLELGIRFANDWKGAVLASVFVSFPLMYRTVRASFEAFNEDLASAGKTLGLSNLYVFLRIRLPACKNGIIAGSVLAFARGLGEYGATQMLVTYSKNTATISTTIAFLRSGDKDAEAMVWILINIAVAAVFLIVINIFENRAKRRNKVHD